jgi:hypothetical protein
MGIGSDGLSVALKGNVPHLHGKAISEKQQAAIQRASGMNLVFHVNQITLAIEGDLVNTESPAVMEKLQRLRDELERYLKTVVR